MISGHQTPEAQMVTAIIMQAYRDMFVLTRSSEREGFTTATEQAQAIMFLTATYGKWADHRNHLCSLIGWDGPVLAARVRRMLDSDAPFPPPTCASTANVIANHGKAVARLRECWVSMNTPRAKAA